MTREEFSGIMLYLETSVGKRFAEMEINGEKVYQLDAYWDLLSDLPATALASAARRAVLEQKYPTLPMPGVLREHALALMLPPALQAMEAWELVLRAVNRYGYANEQRALATLPTLAAHTAQAMGWQSLCDASVEQLPTVRAQFRDAYNQLAQRQEREALPPARYQRQTAAIVNGLAERMGIEKRN